MNQEVFKKLLKRPPDTNKYDFGHVLVVGGSPGMVGAPFLAARGALRIGAGMVTIASMPSVIDKLEKRVEELMTLAYDDEDQLVDFISDRKVKVVVIGPGMKPENVPEGIIRFLKLPAIIDGGALPALAKILNKSSNFSGPRVLTPHAGEFQRFFDESLPKSQAALKSLAMEFAKQHKVDLVLKGHPTYVAHPDGQLYENQTGGPELATAGTGDVLAGMIAGVIAQGIEPGQAAEATVYLHGLAGDLAAEQKTQAGVIASDVIEAIPSALAAQAIA